jgi:hypothetical protein
VGLTFRGDSLEVLVDFLPVLDGRDDSQVDDLIAHLAEMLV